MAGYSWADAPKYARAIFCACLGLENAYNAFGNFARIGGTHAHNPRRFVREFIPLILQTRDIRT